MNIKMKFLTDTAQEPTRGSEYAAGYDLYADAMFDEDGNRMSEIIIPAHETRKIGTGLAFELPKDTFAAIFARSGLATKHGLRPANCVGVCDADYRGEYIVALHNDTDHAVGISEGERIAQMVLMPFIPMEFEKVTELSDTVRGEGGFGSTGSK